MKILNFGSLNIDYVYEVNEFVKKGETISSARLSIYPGGKGLNQSIALSRAGAEVYHAGKIGEDGTILKELLRKTGVHTRFVERSESIRTGNAIIQNDKSGDNCIILYGGANQTITREMIDRVLTGFDSEDWILLQNEINELPYIVEKAHEKKMKIVLNPSPVNDKIFDINLDYIDSFIMNEGEAKAIVGDCEERDELIRRIQRRFPDSEVVLTVGEEGSFFIMPDKIVKQKAYPVECVDTTAAGDTFTGYYIAERMEGKTIEESLEYAAKASAIAVTSKGAAPSIPDKKKVQQ